MIRINLLPFRAARRRENIKRQVSIYGLSVIFLLTLMGYFWLDVRGVGNALRAEKTRREADLAPYADITARLNEIRAKIEETRAKLGVIQALEKGKTGPVQLLEEISLAVPRDRLWLQSLEEKNGILTLRGTAMDHDTVALFMGNLERGAFIRSVDLNSTRLRELAEYRVSVSDFVLSCKTGAFREEPPETPASGRKKTGGK